MLNNLNRYSSLHALPKERRILFIDDSTLDIFLAKTVFEASGIGHRVDTAVDIDEIEALLYHYEQDKSTQPFIAFIDVNLAGSDGFDILERMQRFTAFKNTIKVLMSGCFDEGAEIRGKKVGADFCMTKPVSVEHIELIAKKYPSFIQ